MNSLIQKSPKNFASFAVEGSTILGLYEFERLRFVTSNNRMCLKHNL